MAKRSRSRRQQYKEAVALARRRRACVDAKIRASTRKHCACGLRAPQAFEIGALRHKQRHAGRSDGPAVFLPGQGLPRTEAHSCMSVCSLTNSPSSLGVAPLSSNILFLAMIHNSFCAMKPPSSSSSLNLLHSFLVTHHLSPSTFHFSSFLSGTFPSSSLRSIFIFQCSFVSLFSGGSAASAPDATEHDPSTS